MIDGGASTPFDTPLDMAPELDETSKSVVKTYFETRMEQAEKDGAILKDWRKHRPGHLGDIDARYTHDKGPCLNICAFESLLH